MNWPPMLLQIRFPSGDGFIGLWLPWFLLYPILLALMLVALPFVIVLGLILLPTGKARPLIFAFPYFWRVMFSMRGLKVDIQNGQQKILVNFV